MFSSCCPTNGNLTLRSFSRALLPAPFSAYLHRAEKVRGASAGLLLTSPRRRCLNKSRSKYCTKARQGKWTPLHVSATLLRMVPAATRRCTSGGLTRRARGARRSLRIGCRKHLEPKAAAAGYPFDAYRRERLSARDCNDGGPTQVQHTTMVFIYNAFQIPQSNASSYRL